MSAAGPFPSVEDNVAALQAWLQARLEGFGGAMQVERLAGGRSNPGWRLRTAARDCVLRARPGPRARLLPSAHAIEREFRVQQALAGSGVPVAAMHVLCEDESLIGAGFYVMDFIDGEIFGDQSLPGLEPPARGARYDAMNTAIATLHGLDVDALGLRDYGRSGGYFARQIDRWTRQYAASRGEAIADMERLIAWLPAHLPREQDEPVALVHGDFRLDNLVFAQGQPRLLAVLDWELSTLGHPLADFAYHVMSWHIAPGFLAGLGGLDLDALGIPDEHAYVRDYERRTGLRVGEHWDFCLAYNLFRLAAILQGVGARARAGMATDPEALRFAAQVPALAALGWRFARRAEATA
ncbi:phosphotransferase family protein [uncultured Luteimonas sp.]|uniref:phosphotransferase family protein n=1 Tax=uncultured Luteimonas sp. TaxID=453144 RepID=UPI0026159C21|nr:phosphotransferase family protein [uncultured Luteimonas sp.]